MPKSTRTARLAALAAAAVLPLTLVACGETTGPPVSAAPGADGSESAESMSPSPMSSESMSSPSMSASPSTSASAGAAGAAFGPGCAAVPKTGKGSFDGMSSDPVATAASNNPALGTLVAAVKAAGLVDTLNTTEDITVFAPTNDAFKKVDPATLKKAMGDPKGLLTDVLTAHVVKGKLSPDQVAGEHQSLNPDQKVTVTGSGESFTVNDSAKVVCGNVTTANATVYIIDSVLLPQS